jgi:uncharacterized membrane protein
MARALAAIAVLWPLVQAATVAATIHGSGGALTAMVQIVGSRVCHQRPERSFRTSGVRWPVCARCSGLYFGAACGAWFGFAARMRRWGSGREIAIVLVVASLPTAVTWIAEWAFGVPVANVTRAFAGLPLGAAIAATVVAVASSSPKSIR